jgi:hypothetical protein
MMDITFRGYVRDLGRSTKGLVASPPQRIADGLDNIPLQGVYLFTDKGKHLYVGRSDNIRNRMGLHSRPSSAHNQATFAFRLAKSRLRVGGPTYKSKGSRTDLISDSKFVKAFRAAKVDVRRMEVRFLSEPDPIRQALLEIYMSVALKTPFNDFKTT